MRRGARGGAALRSLLTLALLAAPRVNGAIPDVHWPDTVAATRALIVSHAGQLGPLAAMCSVAQRWSGRAAALA